MIVLLTIVVLLALLALAALPVTLGAVAVRPCRGTVRAAATALVAFALAVLLIVFTSAIVA